MLEQNTNYCGGFKGISRTKRPIIFKRCFHDYFFRTNGPNIVTWRTFSSTEKKSFLLKRKKNQLKNGKEKFLNLLGRIFSWRDFLSKRKKFRGNTSSSHAEKRLILIKNTPLHQRYYRSRDIQEGQNCLFLEEGVFPLKKILKKTIKSWPGVIFHRKKCYTGPERS